MCEGNQHILFDWYFIFLASGHKVTVGHTVNKLPCCLGFFLALSAWSSLYCMNGWIPPHGHSGSSPRFYTQWPSISKFCQLARCSQGQGQRMGFTLCSCLLLSIKLYLPFRYTALPCSQFLKCLPCLLNFEVFEGRVSTSFNFIFPLPTLFTLWLTTKYWISIDLYVTIFTILKLTIKTSPKHSELFVFDYNR